MDDFYAVFHQIFDLKYAPYKIELKASPACTIRTNLYFFAGYYMPIQLEMGSKLLPRITFNRRLFSLTFKSL